MRPEKPRGVSWRLATIVALGASLIVSAGLPGGQATADGPPSPATGDAEEAWIGCSYRPLKVEERRRLERRGAWVIATVPGSPAREAGLLPGDVIVGVGAAQIVSAKGLFEAFSGLAVGQETKVEVLRAGEEEPVGLVLVPSPKDPAKIARAVLRGAVDFLVARQLEDGSWADPERLVETPSVPVAALALRCLVETPEAIRGEEKVKASIEGAIGFLRGRTDANGRVLEPDRASAYKNYATPLTLAALTALDREEDAAWRAKMHEHLIGCQIDEKEGFTTLDWQYGAWNYYEIDRRGHVRADMSVLAHVVDGLARAGVKKDSRTFKKARIFAFACQSVREDVAEETAKALDGGFAFSPRESKVGMVPLTNDDVIYPSYGSATADGLRTILNLGVPRDHPRVKAAADWLRGNLVFDRNPGFPEDSPIPYAQAIRFYWWHGLARALDQLDEHPLQTADGPRDWVVELVDALAREQRPDGSFENTEPTMGEDDPVLATAFATMAAEICLRRLEAKSD